MAGDDPSPDDDDLAEVPGPIPGQSSGEERDGATDRVRREWLRRVEAEYRSAALTSNLVLWLIQIGASPDLIADAQRIVSDEMAHAELSHAVYTDAGGTGTPRIVRETLALRRRPSDPLEHDVLRSGVEIFCLGETVAVRLFKELRAECTVASARVALDRVLVDEVRHRDFGWDLLAWLLDHPAGGELAALLGRELPSMFQRLRGNYAPPGAAEDVQMDSIERSWGLMPSAWYGDILKSSYERDYLPRFEELGVDAESAWGP